MKKSGKAKRDSGTTDIEAQIREIFRQFARQILSTAKQRESAAKAIGHQPSYLRAMLDERGKGGLDAWAMIVDHCFVQQGLNLVDVLSRALSNPASIGQGAIVLTPSEQIFKNLDKISIVDEDVKLEIAISLEKVFKAAEKSARKDKRK